MGLKTAAPVFLLLFVQYACAEIFTSTEEFRVVLEAQRHIAAELKDYVTAEEKRIARLKEMASNYERAGSQSDDEVVKFISNPVNAYLVAKKFNQERADFQELIPNTDAAKGAIERIEPYRMMLPSQEDYEGSAHALLRLQDTYALSAAAFANGIVKDASNSTRLTAIDCFEIGRIAYNNADYYHTVLWMQEALDRLKSESDSSGLDRVAILDYLSYAVYMQGNFKHAIHLTEEILRLDPTHERALKNKAYFDYQLKLRETDKAAKGDTGKVMTDDGETFKNERDRESYKATEEFQAYERLCRGEDTMPVKDAHRLYCDYATNNDPRLLIGPFKREVMHLDPYIALYYNAMSEEEMKFVREIGFAQLDRATIQNSATGNLEFANYRITKTAWLKNDTDAIIIPRLLNRVSAISQLTLQFVEEFQVANYGIGGHYEPHFDFARKEEKNAFGEERGNRLATVLFYLTDIPRGGGTVFTNIGVKLTAVKGAAAVWYNLYKNGEGDHRTRHGACPVLVGNKWVMTKWYHERGNEFWHPCGLSPDDRFTADGLEKAEPTYHRARGRFQFN